MKHASKSLPVMVLFRRAFVLGVSLIKMRSFLLWILPLLCFFIGISACKILAVVLQNPLLDSLASNVALFLLFIGEFPILVCAKHYQNPSEVYPPPKSYIGYFFSPEFLRLLRNLLTIPSVGILVTVLLVGIPYYLSFTYGMVATIFSVPLILLYTFILMIAPGHLALSDVAAVTGQTRPLMAAWDVSGGAVFRLLTLIGCFSLLMIFVYMVIGWLTSVILPPVTENSGLLVIFEPLLRMISEQYQHSDVLDPLMNEAMSTLGISSLSDASSIVPTVYTYQGAILWIVQQALILTLMYFRGLAKGLAYIDLAKQSDMLRHSNT